MSLVDILIGFFTVTAIGGGVVMLLARHPMRVALALIATMLSLAGVYALVGLHAVAVFQVFIYVGAVMVFMVYVIMLLDIGDRRALHRYGRLLWPAIAAGAVLVLTLGHLGWRAGASLPPAVAGSEGSFLVQPFSAAFLADWWLAFELASVVLLVAVLGAIAVIQGSRRHDG
jgi:NADH-quinone oxidoreductase subunit J